MYFVDKELLNQRLDYIESLAETIDTTNNLALERSCHMLIEATVDVGNMIIDAFILRDPGSYQDVIDILQQEKVVNTEDAEKFKNTLKWRIELTRNYQAVDHESMRVDFKKNIGAYKNFKASIEHFYANDPQAITAFSGESDV